MLPEEGKLAVLATVADPVAPAARFAPSVVEVVADGTPPQEPALHPLNSMNVDSDA